MAGVASDGIPFLSLGTTGSNDQALNGPSRQEPSHQSNETNRANGLNLIGDLNLPYNEEMQRMQQELEQLRKEKQEREARRRRRLEKASQHHSDLSEDEAEGNHRGSVKGIGATIQSELGSQPKRVRHDSWREKMEKMIEECRRTGPRELAAEISRDIGMSPFTDDVLNAEKPRRFTMPTFRLYDGTTDPVDHIKGYKQLMAIETMDEKLICKLFPTSLTGPASTWFQDLKPRSIPNFDTLSRVFISQYFCSRKQQKDMASLFNTKQAVGEEIGKFFERFKAEMRQVNCEPQFAAIAFREGLLPDSALYESLMRDPPKDMDDIVTGVEGEIRIESAKTAKQTRITTVLEQNHGF